MLWWTLRQLNSQDRGSRVAALRKLVQHDEPAAVDALIGFLRNSSTHLEVIDALKHAKGPNPRLLPPLLDVLRKEFAVMPTGHANYILISGVDSVLFAFGRVALDVLLPHLDDPEPEIRKKIVRILRDLGNSRARGALVNALRHDPDKGVRGAAALALGKLGDRSASDLLLSILETDGDVGFRVTAGSALGLLKEERAVRPLINELVNAPNHGFDELRATLAEALGNIGHPLAVKCLEELAARDRGRAGEAAKRALNDIRLKEVELAADRNSAEDLASQLSHSSASVRLKAAQALAEMDDPRAVQPLLDFLKDCCDKVVLQALLRLSDPGVTGHLDGLVDHYIQQPKDRRFRYFQTDAKVASLELLLELASRRISPERLCAAFRFNAHRLTGKYGTEDDDYELVPIDCSRIHALAARELERRGLEVPGPKLRAADRKRQEEYNPLFDFSRDDAPQEDAEEPQHDVLIRFTCKQCSRRLKGPAHHAGKKVRCPRCNASLNIPNASET